MNEFESAAQLLTNLFTLSRESVQEAYTLGGAYNCREVTPLDREVYHTVVTAEHDLLGQVRVLLTSGMQKAPDTSAIRSVWSKPAVEDVLISKTTIPFFMLALRPQPIESMHPRIFVNPTIFVACAQDALSGEAQPVISSFWEVLDFESGDKVAGDLKKLGLSSKGLFDSHDRTTVEAFVNFSQRVPDWGVTGTLRRIHSRLSHMKIDKLSQYDLLAGTKSKVTYPSVPAEVKEAAA